MKEIIRPYSEIRNRYSEIVKECREKNTAVILTVNGKGDSVIIDLGKYQKIMAELELLRNLAEAEEDVREGRTALLSESFTSIRNTIESMEFC